MPTLKKGTIMPTAETDAIITATNDIDNPEWTAEMLAKARPSKELRPDFVTKVSNAQKSGALTVSPIGRPKSDKPKQATTIRLDADVLEYFKAGGKGWQTRVNAVLREHVANTQASTGQWLRQQGSMAQDINLV